MGIRKLTLEEWFLKYQLNAIRKNHFHIPIELNADVSKLAKLYEAKGQKIPYTAVLIKAASILVTLCPFVNRTVFSTFYGDRVVDFESVTINVPVIIETGGAPHLSAVAIPHADQLSVVEIQKHLHEARLRKIDQLPIGRFVTRKKNNFFNRFLLKVLHFFAYNFPGLYLKKGGGGISVTSLLHLNETGFDSRPYAFGINAFTISAASVITAGDRVTLKIGVGYDHYAFAGNEAMSALKTLAKILSLQEGNLAESLSEPIA